MIKVEKATDMPDQLELKKITINDELEFDMTKRTNDVMVLFGFKDGHMGVAGGAQSKTLLKFIVLLIDLALKEKIIDGPVKSMAGMLMMALGILTEDPKVPSEKPSLADLMRQEATNGQH